MSQYDDNDALPVPRTRVFVLDDGMFVVQWEEHRVQSLANGRYYNYTTERYGAPISDYELNQLMSSGRVSHYDDSLVYLSPQPMTLSTHPMRSYYLNTRLPKTERGAVEEALLNANLADDYAVRVQEVFVIIRNRTGLPFKDFDEAERAREQLLKCQPELLGKLAVAFVEINSVN